MESETTNSSVVTKNTSAGDKTSTKTPSNNNTVSVDAFIVSALTIMFMMFALMGFGFLVMKYGEYMSDDTASQEGTQVETEVNTETSEVLGTKEELVIAEK